MFVSVGSCVETQHLTRRRLDRQVRGEVGIARGHFCSEQADAEASIAGADQRLKREAETGTSERGKRPAYSAFALPSVADSQRRTACSACKRLLRETRSVHRLTGSAGRPLARPVCGLQVAAYERFVRTDTVCPPLPAASRRPFLSLAADTDDAPCAAPLELALRRRASVRLHRDTAAPTRALSPYARTAQARRLVDLHRGIPLGRPVGAPLASPADRQTRP